MMNYNDKCKSISVLCGNSKVTESFCLCAGG